MYILMTSSTTGYRLLMEIQRFQQLDRLRAGHPKTFVFRHIGRKEAHALVHAGVSHSTPLYINDDGQIRRAGK